MTRQDPLASPRSVRRPPRLFLCLHQPRSGSSTADFRFWVFLVTNRAACGWRRKKGASKDKSKRQLTPALPLPTPPLAKFQIGLCQLSVTADKERNIAHARDAIREAVDKGAQLVLLPEIWNSPYSNDSFPVYAEDIDGGSSPSTAMLSEAAKALKVTIVGSSIPERCGDRLYNACCVFGSIGVLKAKHRKTLDVLV
ncbi:omega-amidase, chloroplastic-like [Syzygium oleosum]|uniref:omega-amidase, chloroplastic-like n=1 Tax=Syzygium oleosum TaxID=219896 RepID=UPI0024BAF735|nr:omega-amidase, chloroplastic-like [Syzygium oleosum]